MKGEHDSNGQGEARSSAFAASLAEAIAAVKMHTHSTNRPLIPSLITWSEQVGWYVEFK